MSTSAGRAAMPESRPGRVIIQRVEPEVDAGGYAVKRVQGDRVRIEADIFAEGHDQLVGRLLYRGPGQAAWQEVFLTPLVNDRWSAEFDLDETGCYRYRLDAWPDRFSTWSGDLRKRLDAGQDLESELQVGAQLVEAAAERAPAEDAQELHAYQATLTAPGSQAARAGRGLEDRLAELMRLYAPREPLTGYDRGQVIDVERQRAGFSAWYELFPRSASRTPGRHGTFDDVIARLPYVASLGFDVLYLPPIHPIGRSNRKGRNNDPVGGSGDVGSPWAIGGPEGGHKAVHPELGTLADFRRLVAAARQYDIEVALDFAVQCSPDHPYVRHHPQWFSHRPDGSIRYAENPPKKYEDIYPIDFETGDWQALWLELESVVLFWIEQGVRIFRVDNPHTKQFAFWEWLIARVRAEYPETIFLAEAFTRPRLMEHLAKIGFSQSYTYFTWRNTKWELTQYVEEVTRPPLSDYFRPNFWPNTPDILHAYLQEGGRPAFIARLVLAATMSGNYGIYGPAFELGLAQPREPGSEEYVDSEKYEVRFWDLDAPQSLRPVIARVNAARRANLALQRTDNLRFLELANDQLVAYSKVSPDDTNHVIVVVNLDPRNVQSGWLKVPLWDLRRPLDAIYRVRDALSDAVYTWRGEWNYVQLEPSAPAHILVLDLPPAVVAAEA